MAHVEVKINGRGYEIACDNGQEEHVADLGDFLDRKVAELAVRIGQVGDSRLLVMAALLIADELSDSYDEISQLREGNPAASVDKTANTKAADGFTLLAQRIEDIAEHLEHA